MPEMRELLWQSTRPTIVRSVDKAKVIIPILFYILYYMVEFTEEQELEIQKRVEEATKYEQWRIAFAQAARIALPYLQGMIDQYDPKTKQLMRQGALDPFVYAVFEAEVNQILAKYFPRAEPVKDDSVKE